MSPFVSAAAVQWWENMQMETFTAASSFLPSILPSSTRRSAAHAHLPITFRVVIIEGQNWHRAQRRRRRRRRPPSVSPSQIIGST